MLRVSAGSTNKQLKKLYDITLPIIARVRLRLRVRTITVYPPP